MSRYLSKYIGILVLLFHGWIQSQSQPNILLILADDLAFTDMSCFGGEIPTPNLDKIASQGIRFSQFHTAPYCAVTRAMVLTGNNNHVAGMGSQDLRTNVEGYEGHLSNRVVTIPQLLKTKGFSTFMAGKWHLGTQVEDNPHHKGFDKSFVMLEGAANHYNNVGVLREPAISPYTENGQQTEWPKGAYSTDLYTDKLLSYIEQAHSNNSPFFGFAAYTSPHWPLQVDERHWKKFEGNYKGGYDSLRIARFKGAIKAGLISENAQLPARFPEVVSWKNLSTQEKKIEERKMELYAGMVDNLDYNVGRLITKLKELGIYEDTIIMFMSDNGAAAEDFVNHSYFGPYIKQHFDNNYNNMGQPDSYVSYGPQWAEAGSAPFKYFKGYTTEGGMRAPLIISGLQIKRSNSLETQFLTLMDIAPTLYDLLEISYPSEYNSHEIEALKGASLLPLFKDDTIKIHDENYVFALEHRGYTMLRKGDWKLVNIHSPLDFKNFELYNIKSDPGESVNIRRLHPNKFESLMLEWEAFSKEVGVVTPTPKSGAH
ncbi:arylsulfatase [Winogradskyella aurantiaca]|uniref:arylsulfatase n=1 Tax=Winogradskyella aurantiaca TaxID=2219558 RepID=UPI000E1CD0CC|nr:arylsulfatase [Winogradskyella aurantiaca]